MQVVDRLGEVDGTVTWITTEIDFACVLHEHDTELTEGYIVA